MFSRSFSVNGSRLLHSRPVTVSQTLRATSFDLNPSPPPQEGLFSTVSHSRPSNRYYPSRKTERIIIQEIVAPPWNGQPREPVSSPIHFLISLFSLFLPLSLLYSSLTGRSSSRREKVSERGMIVLFLLPPTISQNSIYIKGVAMLTQDLNFYIELLANFIFNSNLALILGPPFEL